MTTVVNVLRSDIEEFIKNIDEALVLFNTPENDPSFIENMQEGFHITISSCLSLLVEFMAISTLGSTQSPSRAKHITSTVLLETIKETYSRIDVVAKDNNILEVNTFQRSQVVN